MTTCPQVMLATRLDRLDGFRDAHELGAAMRLPGSPAAVLSWVAAGCPALLVLDQVDAFGAGSGRNPARLEAVTEALRDARALGIKVMIACRTFDLGMDDRLAVLAGITRTGQHADSHHVERLGPLTLRYGRSAKLFTAFLTSRPRSPATRGSPRETSS